MSNTARATGPMGYQRDIEHEAALLEEAREEIRSGMTMDPDEVEAWLDALDGDEDLPVPELRPAPGLKHS